MPLPLTGRSALVTGVSRRRGIGFAVAARLAGLGANLFVQHWSPHDATQPWGADEPARVVEALAGLLAPGAGIADASVDLADAEAPEALVARAADEFGHLDILVANQAMSGGDGRLVDIGAAELDRHWAVDARATLLMTRAFAARHDGRDGGRVVWLTSGQALGPMSDEIAYASAKAALAGVLPSVAADLVTRGILLNAVNPGPVNTGYLDDEGTDRPDRLDDIRAAFPLGRVGEPDDPARLIAWLVGDEGRWVVGQVLNTEGGFRR